MDINSLVANYLKNTNNTEISASQIKETFHSLANDDLQGCNSIFVYGEDATKDELIEYMSKACGKDDEQFKQDVGLLFDVLNSNSEDDVLTSDELEGMVRERGDNKGKIDGFGIWNELLNTNVSQIEAEMVELETPTNDSVSSEGNSSDEIYRMAQEIVAGHATLEDIKETGKLTEEEIALLEENISKLENSSGSSEDVDVNTDAEKIVNSGDIEGGLAAYAVIWGKDSEEYKALEEQVANLQNSVNNDEDGYSTEKINRIAEEIIAGKTTLEDIKETGKLTEEEIAALEEAIAAIENDTEPTTEETLPTGVSTESKIPDDSAKIYAKELFNGVVSSSTDKINDYLDLDSADLVKVISTYVEEGYGSFTKAIEGGIAEYLSKEERQEFINTVMTACIEQAENGNEDAIGILCNEIYSATAQTWGYTGYTVLDSFFNNANNDVINLVKDNYSKYIEGHELRDDINGEAMWFHQSAKNSYISKIDKSWKEET